MLFLVDAKRLAPSLRSVGRKSKQSTGLFLCRSLPRYCSMFASFRGSSPRILNHGEAVYIINFREIAYHQNEVLYIIIAKAFIDTHLKV